MLSQNKCKTCPFLYKEEQMDDSQGHKGNENKASVRNRTLYGLFCTRG